MRRSRLHLLAVLSGCALISGAGGAWAQTAEDINRAQQNTNRILQQEQQRREFDTNRILQRPDVDLDAQQLPQGPASDQEQLCFDIHEIRLNGAGKLSAQEQKDLVAPFEGKCLSILDIDQLVRDITNHYIRKGYITTRAYIPQQNLGEGLLQILVVEGITQKIIPADGETELEALWNVFPSMEGEVLNLNDIEQGLSQLNRLRSNNVTIELQPADEPGQTVILLNNERSGRMHGFVGYDNSGSKGSGKNQASLNLTGESLLGQNELISLTYYNDTHRNAGEKFSRSISSNFIFPYGYWTLSGYHSYYEYRSQTQGTTQPFQLEGTSKTSNLNLDWVFWRQRGDTLSLSTGLTVKEIRNYLEGSKLITSSRNLSIANLNLNHQRSLLGGRLSASVGVEKGLSSFGADDDPDGLAGTAPRNQFTKAKAMIGYMKPFRALTTDMSYMMTASGQFANDYLPGTEQISLGGLHAVRGFDESTIQGDRGGYVRQELSIHLPPTTLSEVDRILGTVSPYMGFDIGHVWSRRDQKGGTMTGGILGLRNFNGILNFDMSYGRAFGGKESLKADRDHTLYFQLSLPF